MSNKQPAMLIYTGDVEKDKCLNKCGPATRGIWWGMIFAMHDDDASGVLSGTVDQLARICRCTDEQMAEAIAELDVTETADVTWEGNIVTLINRRMYRANQNRVNTRERVRKHRGKKAETLKNFSRNSDVTPSLSLSSTLPLSKTPPSPSDGSGESPPSAAGREIAAPTGVIDLISAICKAYPDPPEYPGRHDEGEAGKFLMKQTVETLLVIRASVERWGNCEEWKRDGGRWVKKFSCFLRDGLWRKQPTGPVRAVAAEPAPVAAPEISDPKSVRVSQSGHIGPTGSGVNFISSALLWDQAIEALRGELDPENYSTWVEPVRYHDYADGQMTLLVPSVFFRRWLIKNYHESIESLLARLAGKVITVRYLISPEDGLEDDGGPEFSDEIDAFSTIEQVP